VTLGQITENSNRPRISICCFVLKSKGMEYIIVILHYATEAAHTQYNHTQ